MSVSISLVQLRSVFAYNTEDWVSMRYSLRNNPGMERHASAGLELPERNFHLHTLATFTNLRREYVGGCQATVCLFF